MIDNFIYTVDMSIIPDSGTVDILEFKGQWYLEHWRSGQLLGKYRFPNGIVNVGKDKILDVMFNSVTAIAQSAWCIGIIDNASFSALANGDTMASHAGWIEYVGFSQSTRVAWGPGSSSGQTVTNATAATFDITGTATLYGIFVTSQNTLSGTTGSLWSTAAFPSTIPVTSGDQIKITYSIAC